MIPGRDLPLKAVVGARACTVWLARRSGTRPGLTATFP